MNRAPDHDAAHADDLNPIDALDAEHRLIAQVAAAMKREVDALDLGADIRTSFWVKAVEFFEHFGDRIHHGKEEGLLFAALERAGMSRDHGPLHRTLGEHVQERTDRERIIAALRTRDAGALRRAAVACADHIQHHIEVEQRVLFPLALELLDEQVLATLHADFEAHDHQLGDDNREHYRRIAHALDDKRSRVTSA